MLRERLGDLDELNRSRLPSMLARVPVRATDCKT